MTTFHPASTIGWIWAADGIRVVNKKMRSSIAWQWTTDGFGRRTIHPQNTFTPEWLWSVDTTGEQRKELLAEAGVVVKIYDVLDPTSLLGAVRYEEVTFEAALSGVGGGRCKGSKAGMPLDPVTGEPRVDLLEKDHIWKVEVEGQERFAIVPTNNEDEVIGDDETEGFEMVGKGPSVVLKRAAVAPQDFATPQEQVQRVFIDSSRAAAYSLLLDEAHARGVIPEVTKDSWNAAADAMGSTWIDENRLEFDAGGHLLDKLEEWGPLSFEWYMTSKFGLRLAKRFGRELTNTIILYPAHTVTSQNVERSFEDRANRLFAQDGNDGVSIIEDEDLVDEGPIRELYVVFSDAANEGTRTANAAALLELVKGVATQRSVTVDPFAEGRRPWVDFDLGDTIGVAFDGEVFPFRVLAIGLKANPSSTVAEVTLEYVIEAERRRRQALISTSGNGAGGSGFQILYEDSGPTVVDVSGADCCVLNFEAFRSTYGIVGVNLTGTASATGRLTVQLIRGGSTVVKQWSGSVTAGADSFDATWLWPQIDEGASTLSLRVFTSTGTFSMTSGGGQLWLQSAGIGGQQGGATDIVESEQIPYYPMSAEAVYIDPTFAGGGITETSAAIAYPAAAVANPIDLAMLVLDYEVATTGDDGYATNLPSFSNTGQFTLVGNQGGVLYTAYYRFVVPGPVDLTGATIAQAWLEGVADQTASGALTTIKFENAAGSAAPVNRADLIGRSLTTAAVNWDTSAVSGVTYRSPDLTAIVQELVTNHGDLTSFLVVHSDRTSPLDGRLAFRSQEHATSPAVRLWIRYRA